MVRINYIINLRGVFQNPRWARSLIATDQKNIHVREQDFMEYNTLLGASMSNILLSSVKRTG